MYPFAPGQSVIVPNIDDRDNTKFDPDSSETQTMLKMMWTLVQSVNQRHFVLAVNGDGAHQSVPHQHAQGVMYLPFSHYGLITARPVFDLTRKFGATFLSAQLGPVRYLLDCLRVIGDFNASPEFQSADTRFGQITFNIVMEREGITLFTRRHQNHPQYLSALEAAPFGPGIRRLSTGLAYYELWKGQVICVSPETAKICRSMQQQNPRQLENALDWIFESAGF
jgi:hypothetical protein